MLGQEEGAMGFIRAMAFIFGVILVAVGVMGFIPSLVTDGLLFGYFQVDQVHNLIHLMTGALALLASASTPYSQLFFQIFGIFYGIVTIFGFVFAGNLLFIQVNMADNFLHLGIAIVALFFGFAYKINYTPRL